VIAGDVAFIFFDHARRRSAREERHSSAARGDHAARVAQCRTSRPSPNRGCPHSIDALQRSSARPECRGRSWRRMHGELARRSIPRNQEFFANTGGDADGEQPGAVPEHMRADIVKLGKAVRLPARKPMTRLRGGEEFSPRPARATTTRRSPSSRTFLPGGKRLRVLPYDPTSNALLLRGLGPRQRQRTGEPQTHRNYSWRDYATASAAGAFDLAESSSCARAQHQQPALRLTRRRFCARKVSVTSRMTRLLVGLPSAKFSELVRSMSAIFVAPCADSRENLGAIVEQACCVVPRAAA